MSVAEAASLHQHLVGCIEAVLLTSWWGVVELEHAEPDVGHVEPVLGTREGRDVVGDLRNER